MTVLELDLLSVNGSRISTRPLPPTPLSYNPIWPADPCLNQRRNSVQFEVPKRRDSCDSDHDKRRNSFMDIGQKISDVGRTVKYAADREIKGELVKFSKTTTAHGIPMVSLHILKCNSIPNIMRSKRTEHSKIWNTDNLRKVSELVITSNWDH